MSSDSEIPTANSTTIAPPPITDSATIPPIMNKIDKMYLCGGGINVIAHIGVLSVLDEKQLLTKIKTWIGISAGALLCMAMRLGYTINEMKSFFLQFNFTQLLDPDDSIDNLIGNCGVDTGNKLLKLIIVLLKNKGFTADTLFYELDHLVVFACDLNTGELIEFSKEKTPNYPVAIAIRASMTYPLYFQPQICPQTGHLLVDGGVITNYPLYLWANNTGLIDSILGVSFQYKLDIKDELELEDLIFRPISLLMISRSKREILPFMNRTVIVEMNNKNTLNFEMNDDEKNELIEIGKNAMLHFLDIKGKDCPPS